MSVEGFYIPQARMLCHATLRTHGRRVAENQSSAPWSGRVSRRACRGQPAVCQCGDLDRSIGVAVARPAGAFWPLEFGVSTVQSLVQVRRVGTRRASTSIARPGSTLARLHGDSRASACRGLSKKEAADEALGRSRGGFGSKLHLSIDAQGQLVNVCLGPGEEHDVTRAEELLGDEEPECVIADKAYDSDEFLEAVRQRGAEAVIPPRSNRIRKRRFNKRKYKLRNLAERFINRIKHYRRIATRYEKTACNYLAFVQLASTLVLLGVTVNTT